MNTLRLLWELAKVFLWRSNVPEWSVQQLLLFDEDTHDLLDASQVRVDFYKDDIAHLYPDVPNWKLEVRYRHYSTKYRCVLRPGDPCTWTFPPQRRQGPGGILLATILPVGLDVSARVRKYHGPDHTFSHGLRAHDIFPFDDNDFNAERFETLQILWLGRGFKAYDFKKNDRLHQEEEEEQ